MTYYLILSQFTCSKKVITTFTFCGPAERSRDIAVGVTVLVFECLWKQERKEVNAKG